MRKQITYALVLGGVLCSGCSLFYKETTVYDVFDPESKPIKQYEPRWRIFGTEDQDTRRIPRTHNTLKEKWGRQLLGEWRLAEAERDSSKLQGDYILSFGADDTVQMTVKNGDELLKRDGSYLFKQEDSADGVLIMINWNLSEVERRDPAVVDWLPLVLTKGTNIFLQVGTAPKFIKSDN
jgi:hypothetical protein